MQITAHSVASPRNLRVLWGSLNLENSNDAQTLTDRQTVLDLIRDVYDPMLIEFLAGGGTWNRQFFGRSAASGEFQRRIRARIDELPGAVQSVEAEQVLGLILFDILRFYRFTDPAWQAPPPAAAAAAAAAPPLAPAPAPAPAAIPSPLFPIPPLPYPLPPIPAKAPATAVSPEPATNTALLDALAAAANDALGLEMLCEAAEAVEDASPTYRLRTLADVASRAEPLPTKQPTNHAKVVTKVPQVPMVAPVAARWRGRDFEDGSEGEGPARKRQSGL